MMTLTVTYNPNVLRVRTVQEGTFMRQGGVTATFTPRIDAVAGPGGHRDHAQRRSGGRIGHRAARGAAVRRGRAGQLDDSGERRRQHARGRADHAAVHARDGDGAVEVRSQLLASDRITRVDGPALRGIAQRGFTFIELLVVTTILLILASAVMPLARVTVQRQREAELRRALREMRTGDRQVQGRGRHRIDRVDRRQNRQRRLSAGSRYARRRRVGRERRIGPQAEVPAADSDRSADATRPSGGCAPTRTSRTRRSWGGQNVYDVYTKAEGTGLDGTKYSDW